MRGRPSPDCAEVHLLRGGRGSPGRVRAAGTDPAGIGDGDGGDCKIGRLATTAYSAPYWYDIDPTPLGEWTFGMVHLATDRSTGERFALKRIDKNYTDFCREMDAMIRVREYGGHPHICSLRENFDEGSSYVLVMHLVEGGKMLDRLIESGAYSELDASRLIREAASALAFLNCVGVVHLDMKPKNLMLSSRRANADLHAPADLTGAVPGAVVWVIRAESDFRSALVAADSSSSRGERRGRGVVIVPELRGSSSPPPVPPPRGRQPRRVGELDGRLRRGE